MKKYILEVSQNGWEYTGFVTIECNDLRKGFEDNKTIYADNVKIVFDEEVEKIKIIK